MKAVSLYSPLITNSSYMNESDIRGPFNFLELKSN